MGSMFLMAKLPSLQPSSGESPSCVRSCLYEGVNGLYICLAPRLFTGSFCMVGSRTGIMAQALGKSNMQSTCITRGAVFKQQMCLD